MTLLKTIAFTVTTIALSGIAHAGSYFTDFDEAKAQAKKDGKALLVKFTGSDWCPPCKALQKEVFSQKSFKKGIEDQFVLAVLDFPRADKISAEQKAENFKVAEKYDIKGYPTVLLMNAQGKVFKQMGYQPGGPKPYLAEIKKSLKASSFH